MSKRKRLTHFDGTSYQPMSSTIECVQRLGELEDLQEQGRLIELPCKVGDMVYETKSLFSLHKEHEAHTVRGILIQGNKEIILLCNGGIQVRGGVQIPESEIGKTVFLTQSESLEAMKWVMGVR